MNEYKTTDTILFLKTILRADNNIGYEVIPDQNAEETLNKPYNEAQEKIIFHQYHVYPITTLEQKECKGIKANLTDWIQQGICKRLDIKKDPTKYKIKNFMFTDRFDDMTNDYAEEIHSLDEKLDENIYFEDKKLRISLLMDDIVFTSNGINRGFLVTKDDKKIWRYDGKIWIPDGEDLIKDIMQRILKSHWCSRYVNEGINWIKDNGTLQIDRNEFDSSNNLIGVNNGVINTDTKELRDFRPKDKLTTILPISYDQNAKCQIFQDFLSNTLYEQDIPFIQEMMGYCLIKDYRFAIIFMLVGTGRNGKSTLMKTLIQILGKNNISSVPIHALAESFAGVDLYRKYANICTDIDHKELGKTGKLKQLTGQDLFRVRDLYEKSFQFFNFAKLMFCMNIVPECDDKTIAWNQRMGVVEFPNQFLDGQPETDPEIFNKITTPDELSGIFNWMIEGRDRLLKNKCFSQHKTLDDVKNFMAVTKNPIYQFIEQHIRAKPESEYIKEDIYKKFIEFAVKHVPPYPTMASNHFSTKFKQYLLEKSISFEEGQIRTKEGRPKTWKGIEFFDEEKKFTPLEVASGIDQFQELLPSEVQQKVDNE